MHSSLYFLKGGDFTVQGERVLTWYIWSLALPFRVGIKTAITTLWKWWLVFWGYSTIMIGWVHIHHNSDIGYKGWTIEGCHYSAKGSSLLLITILTVVEFGLITIYVKKLLKTHWYGKLHIWSLVEKCILLVIVFFYISPPMVCLCFYGVEDWTQGFVQHCSFWFLR